MLSNDQSCGFTHCKVLVQDTQEQNLGDEGGKRVVIDSDYVQPGRRAVTDGGWEGYWKCERKDWREE